MVSLAKENKTAMSLKLLKVEKAKDAVSERRKRKCKLTSRRKLPSQFGREVNDHLDDEILTQNSLLFSLSLSPSPRRATIHIRGRIGQTWSENL